MDITRQLSTQTSLPAWIRKWWIDCLACAAFITLAVVIGLRATASGPGISPDSVTYISMGANIFRGNGFVSDLSNAFDTRAYSPVTSWPPAFPLLIAGFMVFGLPAVEAARWVNILCFALFLCVLYWLAQNLAGRKAGILCSMVALSLMPVIHAATFALSEMPFMLFTTLAAAGFVQSMRVDPGRRSGWWILSAAGTALAILTRYAGLIWVLTGLIALGFLTKTGSQGSIARWIRRAVQSMLFFSLISLAPILPWFVRNKALTGQITGVDRFAGYHPNLAENIRYALSALAGELIPSIHIGLRAWLSATPISIHCRSILMAAAPVLLIGGVAAVIVLRGRGGKQGAGFKAGAFFNRRVVSMKDAGESGVEKIQSTTFHQEWMALLIPVLFSVSYLVVVIVLSSIQLFPAYDWPRILVVIYPLILTVLICIWALAARRVLRGAIPLVREFTAVLPALLLLIPYAAQSAGFIPLAAQGQEVSAPAWRENQGIHFLMGTVAPQDVIFSARPDGVSYVMGRPARYLPYRRDYDRFSALVAAPKTGLVYIIVFKGALGEPDPYLAPRLSSGDIARLAAAHSNIQPVADFSDSTVYRIK